MVLGARSLRGFGAGFLAVLIGPYLEQRGFQPLEVGVTLAASVLGTALATALAARVSIAAGRRRAICGASLLGIVAMAVFVYSPSFPALVLAALTGTMAITGSDYGLPTTVEQAIVPQLCSPTQRNRFFGRYNLVNGLSASLGGLAASPAALLQSRIWPDQPLGRPYLWLYMLLMLAVAILAVSLSPAVESHSDEPQVGWRSLDRPVWNLAGLFAIDAIGGGFVLPSFIPYWLHLRYGASPSLLGPLFFGAGLLQASSYVVAARLADRIGLVKTMVFTHLPSNLLLLVLPLAPTFWVAALVVLARQAISSMDVPARQAYVMSVVRPNQRAAAAGLTITSRNLAQTLSPAIGGLAVQLGNLALPLALGGSIKIVYDLALYRGFRARLADHETADHET